MEWVLVTSVSRLPSRGFTADNDSMGQYGVGLSDIRVEAAFKMYHCR
eukprot:gene8107-1353_t